MGKRVKDGPCVITDLGNGEKLVIGNGGSFVLCEDGSRDEVTGAEALGMLMGRGRQRDGEIVLTEKARRLLEKQR